MIKTTKKSKKLHLFKKISAHSGEEIRIYSFILNHSGRVESTIIVALFPLIVIVALSLAPKTGVLDTPSKVIPLKVERTFPVELEQPAFAQIAKPVVFNRTALLVPLALSL
ncbi:hypothetical protein J2T13_002635 [Paenibacillus sp. DS2015]